MGEQTSFGVYGSRDRQDLGNARKICQASDREDRVKVVRRDACRYRVHVSPLILLVLDMLATAMVRLCLLV